MVDRLQCVRGISTLTAFGLSVQIGGWHRFTGRTIGAYLGLVPTEYSSESSRVQGGLTKTGNSDVCQLLIQATWHHRKPYDRYNDFGSARNCHTRGPSTWARRQPPTACSMGSLRSVVAVAASLTR